MFYRGHTFRHFDSFDDRLNSRFYSAADIAARDAQLVQLQRKLFLAQQRGEKHGIRHLEDLIKRCSQSNRPIEIEGERRTKRK